MKKKEILSLVFVALSFGVVLVGAIDGEAAQPSTTTNAPILKVCDVCDCKDKIINCSNRNLTTNLHDYEWPKISIELVNFNDNQITKVKKFPNATIYNVTLRNNQINSIEPMSFMHLVNLMKLDLSHNLLTRENLMPSALKGEFRVEAYEPLLTLRVLDLSWNKFHIINRDLFEHTKDLKVLSLAGNPLTYFETDTTYSLNEVPYLEELDLSYCKLKKMDESTLHSVRFLKKLNVSYNEFQKIPRVLQSVPILEKLILDGNPIEFINLTDGFPVLNKLTELSMRNMSKFVVIENGSLSVLPALEVLRIENCPLFKEIKSDAFTKKAKNEITTWPPLKKLYLANNSLEYLASELLARWDQLEVLQLTNNKWTCDCNNQYLIDTVLGKNAKHLMSDSEYASLNCSSPPEMAGKFLKSLAGKPLRCSDLYGGRPERDAAVLVGMLLGVLLAVPVVLIIFVMWRRGFWFCGKQGPASFSRAFYRRAAPYDYDI